MDESRRLAMRRKHAKYGHLCRLCGRIVYGNGGWASHKRYHARQAGFSKNMIPWVRISDIEYRLEVWAAETTRAIIDAQVGITQPVLDVLRQGSLIFH